MAGYCGTGIPESGSHRARVRNLFFFGCVVGRERKEMMKGLVRKVRKHG
ncbi:MAG: hypothetical protein WBZ33_06315 [Thermoactinomyces sp.]